MTPREKYDPAFGDDNKCLLCNHTYYRHFDSYTEHMDPVGCKYCSCLRFESDRPERTASADCVCKTRTEDDPKCPASLHSLIDWKDAINNQPILQHPLQDEEQQEAIAGAIRIEGTDLFTICDESACDGCSCHTVNAPCGHCVNCVVTEETITQQAAKKLGEEMGEYDTVSTGYVKVETYDNVLMQRLLDAKESTNKELEIEADTANQRVTDMQVRIVNFITEKDQAEKALLRLQTGIDEVVREIKNRRDHYATGVPHRSELQVVVNQLDWVLDLLKPSPKTVEEVIRAEQERYYGDLSEHDVFFQQLAQALCDAGLLKEQS